MLQGSERNNIGPPPAKKTKPNSDRKYVITPQIMRTYVLYAMNMNFNNRTPIVRVQDNDLKKWKVLKKILTKVGTI